MKPSVLFITKTCYLDAALEYIDEVKNHVSLHVIIEIDPHSKNRNISNIKKLPKNVSFIDTKKLLDPADYLFYEPYIKGCASFEFLVHQQKKSLSITSFGKSYRLYKKTKELLPEFIHFDDVSIRLIPFAYSLFLLKTKLIINVHDPIQHSGEKNWKNILANKVFYQMAYKFVTFSNYSKSIFLKKYKGVQNCTNLQLKPYRFYSNYVKRVTNDPIYISFIGRISAYKGIDIFLDSIAILNAKYSEVRYIIAGAPYNSTIGNTLMNKHTFKNVEFKMNHLSNVEICEIIRQSKLIVCPYRDATQSGVVMTSLALSTPVIVSNQGGLPEYIEHNVTGMISETNAESFADAIETFLIDPEKHNRLSENISNMDLKQFAFGKNKIVKLYS